MVGVVEGRSPAHSSARRSKAPGTEKDSFDRYVPNNNANLTPQGRSAFDPIWPKTSRVPHKWPVIQKSPVADFVRKSYRLVLSCPLRLMHVNSTKCETLFSTKKQMLFPDTCTKKNLSINVLFAVRDDFCKNEEGKLFDLKKKADFFFFFCSTHGTLLP